jgi:GDPmannose 4,6-dehydratase
VVFDGEGLNEKCIDKKTNKILCKVNKSFYRPSDVLYLKGDSTKIKKDLGWSNSVTFEQLVEKMTTYDLKIIK